MLLQKFLGEWEKIIEKKDYECLKAIYDTIKEKEEVLSSESVYKELDDQIIGFIEKEMLQGELSPYFDYFINTFQRSTLDVNVYLEKIFTDGNITPYTLGAFFKFFKEYADNLRVRKGQTFRKDRAQNFWPKSRISGDKAAGLPGKMIFLTA